MRFIDKNKRKQQQQQQIKEKKTKTKNPNKLSKQGSRGGGWGWVGGGGVLITGYTYCRAFPSLQQPFSSTMCIIMTQYKHNYWNCTPPIHVSKIWAHIISRIRSVRSSYVAKLLRRTVYANFSTKLFHTCHVYRHF